MRYLVPLVALRSTAVMLWFCSRVPGPDLAVTLRSVLAVILADWAKTRWYERRIAERDIAIARIKAICEVDQSAPAPGAYSQD